MKNKATNIIQGQALIELHATESIERELSLIDHYGALMASIIKDHAKAHNGALPSSHDIVYQLGVRLGHDPQQLD